ncbi:hypothetical protein WMF20_04995 [Sorangium sp. So ce834]|uniref:hypothetical protein n=1 Tax=Sorangium sp. So ce834 TaxID=3133321 RepID=UPI003F6060BC
MPKLTSAAPRRGYARPAGPEDDERQDDEHDLDRQHRSGERHERRADRDLD